MRDLLRRADVRLITFTGPGGIGKTRLAVQAAWQARADFPDGVHFISLASITGPELVWPTIAQALGLRETGGRSALDDVADCLSDQRALLLLDNFEQVIAAAPALADLAVACPDLKPIVTSREALHLRGEHEYPVPPLPIPAEALARSPASLAAVASVRLFLDRAQALQPDFDLSPANATAVAQICARLEGWPLSLELAAALLARLGSRLQLLTDGARDLPVRQQSLRNALAWSYALLDADEQRLFRRLGVFAGGAALEAAGAVANLAGEPPLGVLRRASSLVAKSLLLSVEGPGGEPRLRLLETVREYALEQLQLEGESPAARRAQALFYLDLAEQAEPILTGPEQKLGLDRLQADHDNLRAALRWAVEHGDGDTAARLCSALWLFWFARGYLSEGRRWIEAAGRLGQPNPVALARALAGAGLLAIYQADFSRAVAASAESLALFRQLGLTPGIGLALNGLAFATALCGNFAQARIFIEESSAIFWQLDDRWGLANALNLDGFITWCDGDNLHARALADECLSLFRDLGDQRSYGLVLFAKASICLSQGEPAVAQAIYEESLDTMRALDDQRSVAMCLNGLGNIALSRNDRATARAYWLEAVGVLSTVGDRWYTALVVEGLAGVAAAEKLPVEAARLFGAAEALRDAMQAPLLPPFRVFYERNLRAARAQLDAAAFATAWAQGRGMTPETAIAAFTQARPLAAALPAGLTAREVEVLRLLAAGLTNAQIAAHLVISPTTVNAHLRAIYPKLEVRSRSAATRFAIQHGLA